MITQSINLDLIPGGVLPRINVSQYDKGSRTLLFNLFSSGLPFEVPEGSTVTIQGTKPDMTGFQYHCSAQGSIVTADLTDQMTVLAGEVTTEIVITDTSLNILGTCNFIINVENAALSKDTIVSKTDLPLLQEAIQAAAEAAASASAAAEFVDDSEAYAIGTRGGVPVTSGDPAYHKNAKYFSDNFVGCITDAQWTSIEAILAN